MKEVLALLSPTIEDRPSAGTLYALALARAHGARLSALMAEIEPFSFPPEPDNVQADCLRVQRPSATERLTRTGELILSMAKHANVACEILRKAHEFVSLREQVIYLAQTRDVLIIDVYGPLLPPRKDLVEGALFGSGRPLILVPQSGHEPVAVKVLIAWDASRSAVRAVHDALPLLLQARDVNVVSVIDDKTLSIPATGDSLCRHLARWNVSARFDAVNRESLDVGMALLAYARRIDANLLVMGGFAHGFERELMLGSATRDIFCTSLEIPVLLSH